MEMSKWKPPKDGKPIENNAISAELSEYMLKRLDKKLSEIKSVLNTQLLLQGKKLQHRQTTKAFTSLQQARKVTIDHRLKTQHSYNFLDAPKFHMYCKVEKKLIEQGHMKLS